MQTAPLLSLEEHLFLSARINYLLAAKKPSYSAILSKILERGELPGSSKIAEDGIEFVNFAYQNRSRRLGPLAVLHPLRTAHLLILAIEQPSDLDLLTAFLHDYYEDIYTKDNSLKMQRELEANFSKVTQQLTPNDQQHLEYRLHALTKRDDEQYYTYLGRVMKESKYCAEIIWIKLADRLDNTFDMRVVEDETTTDDCFRRIFDILFLRVPERPYFVPKRALENPIDEAHRLFQMFKNAVFLSLVRRSELDRINYPAQRLFNALALASLQESGRILMHVFNHEILDVGKQRELVEEVLDYSQSGGLNRLTPAKKGHRLDGLFKERFDHPDKAQRETAMVYLQQDQEQIAISALAFLGVFESFLSSSSYRLGGVREGYLAEEETLISSVIT